MSLGRFDLDGASRKTDYNIIKEVTIFNIESAIAIENFGKELHSMPADSQIIVVGFFHTWSSDKTLQSPYHGIVAAFESLGIDLKIIFSNDLVQDNIYSISDSISEKKIIEYIQKLNPTFVLSINNGGMSTDIRKSIHCPVIKWLFDDFPHLFFHNGVHSLSQAFSPEDIVITYSSAIASQVEQRYPFLRGRIHFLPHATDTNIFKEISWEHKYNVSFVGSCLDNRPIVRILSSLHKQNPNLAITISQIIERLRDNYFCDFEAMINDYQFEDILKSEQICNWLEFKRILSDVVTTQDRVAGIEAVKHLGVSLFGGINWLEPLLYKSNLVDCYQFGNTINTQRRLAEIYQSSKISIDIPNVQNQNAISGRVIDVMASGSLLITKFQKDSDAYKIFGTNCPIPFYRNLDHLKELIRYYLEHEDERLAIVNKCNQLVSCNYNFRDRVKMIITILNIEHLLSGHLIKAEHLPTIKFGNYYSLHFWLSIIKKRIRIIVTAMISPANRLKLINLLGRAV